MTPSEPAPVEPVTPAEPVAPAESEPVAAPPDVRRLHPLSPFFDLIVYGRQFLLPFVVLVFANRGDGTQFLPVIPLVLGTVAGFLRWLRFTYSFDGRRLVIDEGVLTRKQRIVPLDRIQQVELITKFRHRLFGVTVLRVDTAGGGGAAEIDLSVVSVAEASRLRTLLRGSDDLNGSSLRPGADGADAAAPAPEEPLVTIGVGRLAVAGMTGAEMAVMLTILFWLFQVVDDLPASFVSDVADEVAAPSSVGGFASAAAVLLVLWFGLAAGASILKNFGFTMRRAGDDLRIGRGLFDRREGSMPIPRLQVARVQATVVRRALGLVEVVLQSAGQATDNAGGVSRIAVPILPADLAPPLLAQLLPAPPPDPSTYVGAPPAAGRRAILRRVLPVALVVAVAFAFGRSGWVVAAGLVAVVLAAVAGELAYRGLAHAWEREILVARAGGLARETVVVPAAKAQSTRLRTTPFQRRAGLATLFVDVAGKGRTPQVRDGDVARLRELQRAVLLTSSAAREDESTVRRRRRRAAPA